MESFESMLSAGGHMNSLGRSNEVYDIVKSNTSRMEELFNCIYADDAWVRMRAIDTFEKLVSENPELAQPFIDALIDDLTLKSQPSIQWHLAQLFTEIELSPTHYKKAVEWLKGCVSTIDVDWIVSANAMKALLHFYDKDLINDVELIHLFKVQTKHDSKTVRKKAKLFTESVRTQK